MTWLKWVGVLAGLALLGVGAWSFNSYREYVSCRTRILESAENEFKYTTKTLQYLSREIHARARPRGIANWLSLMMRRDCKLSPPSHRDSPEHRLVWSFWVGRESDKTVALMVVNLNRQFQAIPKRGGKRDLSAISSDELTCLVEATMTRAHPTCVLVR
jgi:hypothetical protein